MMDKVVIEGRYQEQLAVSTSAALAGGGTGKAFEDGIYDFWCDVDVWIRVAIDPVTVTPQNPALSVSNGYKIFAGNTVPIQIDHGRKLQAIAGAAGTLCWHKISE